jgi:hypothetical protein
MIASCRGNQCDSEPAIAGLRRWSQGDIEAHESVNYEDNALKDPVVMDFKVLQEKHQEEAH